MAFNGESEEPEDFISLMSGGSIPGLSGGYDGESINLQKLCDVVLSTL